jgi:hypothetical protein
MDITHAKPCSIDLDQYLLRPWSRNFDILNINVEIWPLIDHNPCLASLRDIKLWGCIGGTHGQREIIDKSLKTGEKQEQRPGFGSF